MDKHRRDLVRRLFTLATEILEDAHEPISKGQGVRHRPSEYRAKAIKLMQVAEDLGSIAGAVIGALRSTIPGGHT
jgi:hypothetical protein